MYVMLAIHNEVDELWRNNHHINLKMAFDLIGKNMFQNAIKVSFMVVFTNGRPILQKDDRPYKEDACRYKKDGRPYDDRPYKRMANGRISC